MKKTFGFILFGFARPNNLTGSKGTYTLHINYLFSTHFFVFQVYFGIINTLMRHAATSTFDATSEVELCEKDEEFFIENGYLIIKNAFSKKCAERCRDIIDENIRNECPSNSSNEMSPLLDNSTDMSSQWVEKKMLSCTYSATDGYPWNEVCTSKKLINSISFLLNGKNVTSTRNDVCVEDQAAEENTYCKNNGKEKNCIDFDRDSNNWEINNLSTGWWVITYPTKEPWDIAGHWHIDGYNCSHQPYSTDLGLVLIHYYSDVLLGGGGTTIAVGSHLPAARALVKSTIPTRHCNNGHVMDGNCDKATESGVGVGFRLGLSNIEFTAEILQLMSKEFEEQSQGKVTIEDGQMNLIGENNDKRASENETMYGYPIKELCGEAGDVILLHPYLLHTRSRNASISTNFKERHELVGRDKQFNIEEGMVRYMSHPKVSLKHPMCFQDFSKNLSASSNSVPKFCGHSILEKSILHGLKDSPDLLHNLQCSSPHLFHSPTGAFNSSVPFTESSSGISFHKQKRKYIDMELENLFGFSKF